MRLSSSFQSYQHGLASSVPASQLVLLLCIVASTVAANDNVFSVQFVDFESGPLDPGQQELIEAFQEKVTVFIYPTTYSQHSVQLNCLNYTLTCVGSNPHCTPSAVFEFVGTNSSFEFAAIQNPGPGGYQQLATDVSVNAIAIGASLYGTSVATAAPAGSGLTSEIIIYAVAIPGAVLVLLLVVWLGIRAYIKKHKYREEGADYLKGDDQDRSSSIGEELLAREDVSHA